MSTRPKIEEIIASLEGAVLEEREAAAEELEALGSLGMNAEEGVIALRAAARQFPPRKYEWQDSSAGLVRAAAARPRSEYVAAVEELFPHYSDRARVEALELLARLPDREAAVAYMSILKAYAGEGGVPALATGTLEDKPRHADVFFPNLLDYASVPGFEWNVYLLCLRYLEEGLLTPGEMLPYADQVLTTYRGYEEELRAAQRREGFAWMWEDDYQEGRWPAALLLDLMGYFPTPEVERELQQALAYDDPRLKHFALVSLLRQGKDVAEEHVFQVAGSPEMRKWFYHGLQVLDQEDLFPEAFKTEEAFAEADMVNWLTFPTELARVPDEIELMEAITIDTETGEGLLVYYLFRFRTHPPHWAAEDGWMAGVSGPFSWKDTPGTVLHGRDTFSSFESWDSKTPEQHLEGTLKALERIP